MRNTIWILSLLLTSSIAEAKLKIVTTTTDIRSLVSEVAQDKAEVRSIARGSQDPHYIEAKPSFMVQVRDANLVIANGLSLEVGWLPSLLRGARNPKVLPGTEGYLELGTLTQPLDIPTTQVTRAQGDVHPDGNPHFTLDPVRNADLALKIADRLGQLDPGNKDAYKKNASAFKERIMSKVPQWQKRIDASKVKKVITYHPTLNYFMKRFGVDVPIYLENKAGIPPTAQHILSVIETIKNKNIQLILVDNFFDTKIADRAAKNLSSVKVASVGVSVDSKPHLKTLEDVTEQIVQIIERP